MFAVLAPDLSVSDHSPIKMYLKVNSVVSFATSKENVLPKPQKLNWDSKIKDRFTNLINSENCKSVCRFFLETGIKPEQTSVDAGIKFISDIMVETAEKADLSLKLVRNLGKPAPWRGGQRSCVKPRPKQPEWHNETCATAHRKFQETSRFLQREPNNPWLSG